MLHSFVARLLLAACLVVGACASHARREEAPATSEPLTIAVDLYRLPHAPIATSPACRIEADGPSSVVVAGTDAPDVERLAAPRVTCLPDQPASITISSDPSPGMRGRTLELTLSGHRLTDGSTRFSGFNATIREHLVGPDGRVTERTRRAEQSFSLPHAHRAVITLPPAGDDSASFLAVVRVS